MAIDIARLRELAERLLKQAEFYAHRPSVDERRQAPMTAEISKRECLGAAIDLCNAATVLPSLLDRIETLEGALRACELMIVTGVEFAKDGTPVLGVHQNYRDETLREIRAALSDGGPAS